MKAWLAFMVLLGLSAASPAAEESLAWPRFRGANGAGIAENQKPPVEIGPEKNLKWKVPVPSGLSSPIVAGGNLVLTAFENGRLYTIAYRRSDGKEAWRAEAPAEQIEKFMPTEGSPAASTPATDGQRILSYFGSCGLFCYDLAGNELWRREMPTVSLPGDFGTGVSPIIAEGLAILVRDERKGAKVLALDVATGELKWQKQRHSVVSYATPVLWKQDDGSQQLVVAGHGRMIAYDLKSGGEVWSYIGMPSSVCSSPVIAGEILCFAGWAPGAADDSEFQLPSFDETLKQFDKDGNDLISREEGAQAFPGFFDSMDSNADGNVSREENQAVVDFLAAGKNSAFALKAGGRGDITRSHVLWEQKKGLPYVPTAIAYMGQLMMVKDGGIVTVFDQHSGRQLSMSRVLSNGSYYASPVAANGAIYFVSLKDGAVTVLKGGTDWPEVVAENPPLEERVAATPAIADDALYIRGEKHLYAFANAERP
jgi:outer membrane protein assembly factor BamB